MQVISEAQNRSQARAGNRSPLAKALALALIGAGPIAAAVVGARATGSGRGLWYRTLRKPRWNPPSAVFGPVWTALYIAMGWSAYRVWRTPPSRARTRALALWGTQMLFNGLWSPIFFGRHAPRAALLDIGALLPSIALYTRAAAPLDRPAAWLMVPYLAWTTFATALNARIVTLN